MVKIEQEVRALPEKEQRFLVQRFVPIVEELAANQDGRGDLAAICAAYMREHKPEVRVTETPPSGSSEPARRPPERSNDDRPRRRRRGRKHGSSGTSG